MPPQAAGTFGPKQDSKVPRKRKRGPGQHVRTGLSDSGRPVKQLKGNAGNLQPAAAVKHTLLAQYYPVILTLRQYVLESLPASSKIRRKKISAVGKADQAAAEDAHTGAQHSEKDLGNIHASLARLLDTTLVATHSYPTAFKEAQPDDRFQRWVEYSQKGDGSNIPLSGGVDSALYCQTEIVDFIIWLLFEREVVPSARPHHLLCDGFQKHAGPRHQSCSVQGLYSSKQVFPNERVAVLKQTPWPQLLSLLGRAGEGMMINLLLECAIFIPIGVGQNSYYQLSGQRPFLRLSE